MDKESELVPGDDELTDLLRLDAHGVFDLADEGFTAAVVRALPSAIEPEPVLERPWILCWLYVVAISLATLAALSSWVDFVAVIADAAWWASPQIWGRILAPLVVLSGLSLAFARDLADD